MFFQIKIATTGASLVVPLPKKIMQIEEWKIIPEIEGKGAISPNGLFKFYNYNRTGQEKITVGYPDADGHLRVSLYANGKQRTVFVHRLVAKAFNPIPEKYKGIPINRLVVHHKDFNPRNNRFDNLEWMTIAEHNALHDSMPIEMLTMDWAHEEYFASASDAARQTGMSKGNISDVCRGKAEYTSKNGVKHRFRYINKEPQGI